MLPLRDTIRSRSVPVVNWIIIFINAIVFFYELSLSQQGLQNLVYTYGLVPSHLNIAQPLTFLPFITHMFLHGGWIHFLSNMWVLFIFGDNVEDRIGSGRYLLFYILGGFAAAALQVVLQSSSDAPAIGASGAIAAVMGAYFLFFPRARVLTVIPIFIIPWLIEVPAIVFLGFWFVTQLFSGLASIMGTSAGVTTVAWFAHIGGFIFGVLMGRIFAYRRRPPNWHPDEYYPW